MKLSRIIRLISVIGGIAVMILIYYLTTRNPETTISESNRAIALLPSIMIQPVNNATGEIIFSARKMAHFYEFLLLGLFVFSFLLSIKRLHIILKILLALFLCVASSLFDQFHKLFVPGREFDAQDLLFDAAGYLSSMIITILLYCVAHIVKKKRDMRKAERKRRKV